jgi:hypothetical protein
MEPKVTVPTAASLSVPANGTEPVKVSFRVYRCPVLNSQSMITITMAPAGG